MNIKPNIWIFPIEPLDTRYTGQWHANIPKQLEDISDRFNIRQIDGIQKNTAVSKGAFLNFADTNYWKSTQLINFLNEHNAGGTTKNDRFLITDFWNPIVSQLKYISELTNLNWQFHGVAHAGSYDPQDFLGRLIDDKRWTKSLERSFFHSYDQLYFATDFHIDLFKAGVFGDEYEKELTANDIAYKFVKSGQPHEGLIREMEKFAFLPKRNLILFPHRLAPEKQPEIFRDLAKSMPEYEFVVCQDQKLTKDEYHKLLGESKIVFSANLQETLGISSCIEAPAAMSLPLVPNSLSYKEIFDGYDFTYPNEWTADYNAYIRNKKNVINRIRYMIENYDTLAIDLMTFRAVTLSNYATGNEMFSKLVK